MIHTEKFTPSGTVLYGKAMIAQLTSELAHENVKKPVILTSTSHKRKARKVARMKAPDLHRSLPVMTEDPPEDTDFIILVGGADLVHRCRNHHCPKALIPINTKQLKSITAPLTEYLVIDSRWIKDSRVMEDFFRNFAHWITGQSLIAFPEKLHIPTTFSYSCRTQVFSGNQSLKELPDLMEKLNIKRPLILSDRGIEQVGLLEVLKENLKTEDFCLFLDIPPDSNSNVVNEISRYYREKNRDGLIAFGGGSVLDTGKGVYMNVSLDTDDLNSYSGSGRIPRLFTPFIAIPTTSGTGSEVTKAAVINDESRGRKILFISPNLQPDLAILDSRLTASLPPFLTSITAMDALSHAVEAYTCIGKNPLSDQMAWTAISLIRKHLLGAIENPGDLTHRLALAKASTLAGQAFSNSMVGMVHTIGHSIGAVCHAPHGSCMSVLLPYGLEYNFEKIKFYLHELLPALSEEEDESMLSSEEKAWRTIELIREMNSLLREKTGGRHPEKLSHMLNRQGEPLVAPKHFEDIAQTALGDASIVYNPEELRFKDIMGVLKKSY